MSEQNWGCLDKMSEVNFSPAETLVPLFVNFSFSPMEISVTDFSAPIGASVFKFCLHLQDGKVYCANGN